MKTNERKQIEKKKNNKSAVFKGIALCICILAVLGLLLFFARNILYNKSQQEQIEELLTMVEEPTSKPTPIAIEEEEAPTEAPTEEPTKEPEINPYTAVFEQNEDMVAWIKIEDTRIDLPVVQTMENEEKYLRLDFDGNYNTNGTLIMDTDSDTVKPSTNLIIHGHHMRSGEMFGELDFYADEDYAKEHEIITMYFPEKIKEYQVIAVFYSQVYKKSDQVFKYYKFFEAQTEEEFNDYYDNCKNLAVFDTGIEAEFGDELLTLSTCAYQVDNGRFVVVAKKINEQEVLYKTVEE